jgi:hypothetical protein
VCSSDLFGTPDASFFNDCLPSPLLSNAIFAFWDDLITRTPGVCTATVGTAPNRQFVVTWNDAMFFGTAAGNLTFSLFLNEGTNTIDVVYSSMTGDPAARGNSATIGVQDIGATNTQHSCNMNAVMSGTAIRFTPVP